MFPLSWRWFLSKGERFMRVDINPNRTMIQIPLYSSCWQKCTFLSRNKMQTYPPLPGQSRFRLISNSKVVLLTEKPFSLFLVWLSLVSLAQVDLTWHVQPQGWQTHQQAGLSYAQFREWSEPPFTLALKCICQNLPNGCLLLSDLAVTLRGHSKSPLCKVRIWKWSCSALGQFHHWSITHSSRVRQILVGESFFHAVQLQGKVSPLEKQWGKLAGPLGNTQIGAGKILPFQLSLPSSCWD